MSFPQNEIELMLRKGLQVNLLSDYCIKLIEKQNLQGYTSEVTFVQIGGLDNSVSRKKYNLALKCGKNCKALRETVPLAKNLYQNEINFYNKILPAFRKFELDRNLGSIFESIPRCFGTYSEPNMEMIILEAQIVLNAYGKFHAISAAFRDQEPEKFAKLAKSLQNICKLGQESDVFSSEFARPKIEIAVELLKNEIDSNVSEKWLELSRKVESIIYELTAKSDFFTVISHGDCWTGNIMFKYNYSQVKFFLKLTKYVALKTNGKSGPIPIKAIMVDWQMSTVYSPVMDISYFLYTSVSPQDLEDFDSFLQSYYTSFSRHVKLLGSDPQKLYSNQSFKDDFKVFAKFGAMMAPAMINISLMKPHEGPDIAKTCQNGDPLMTAYNVTTRDIRSLKNRLKAVMEHAVANDFL